MLRLWRQLTVTLISIIAVRFDRYHWRSLHLFSLNVQWNVCELIAWELKYDVRTDGISSRNKAFILNSKFSLKYHTRVVQSCFRKCKTDCYGDKNAYIRAFTLDKLYECVK